MFVYPPGKWLFQGFLPIFKDPKSISKYCDVHCSPFKAWITERLILCVKASPVLFVAGQLRVWSFQDGKCVFTETVLSARSNKNKNNNDDDSDQQIVHAALCENLSMVAVVTFDHNIVFHELESLRRTKQVLFE